ncbi:hypothetical protein [Apibacter sp. HY039]|uniref:hypothetical protein n=1 Tax=Apibacter sp. HY039 TaxID=2501476 RepID=UPI000FEBCAF3|nr:hypothetical protein [Apibacter sp. HY039]
MKSLVLIVFILCFLSCKKQNSNFQSSLGNDKNNNHHINTNKTSEKFVKKPVHMKVIEDSVFNPGKYIKFKDTIRINYEYNEDLFEILPLIPDSAMNSWRWSKKERKQLISSIKKNNYFVDTDPRYNNVQIIKPNYFRTQVVDGSWCMSLYKIQKDHFIIITNDMVGDGKEIMSFEYKNNVLTPYELKNIYYQYPNNLINDSKCKEELEEILSYIDYDFYTKNQIKIYYPISKKDCYNGNLITYIFNKKDKNFHITDITWILE